MARPASRLTQSRVERYARFDELNRPYLEWQLEWFRPHLGRRVLEIGCGVGGILDLLGPRELIRGIDVDPEVLDFAAKRFAVRPEVKLQLLDFGQLSASELARLRADRFDSVVCINLLEHLEDDRRALRAMEDVLSPGGHLLLLVPAHRALYGAYDALDGHFRRYSKRELRSAIASTGLELVRLRHFNAIGAMGWWVQYKLLRRSMHGGSQFGIMNRVLPIVRPLESRIEPPFGLSIVAVCRRPATDS
jgi:SAM-dependent methyltransferase